ncbi:hypothetical protein Achl_3051 [Pseudarthrobacter chlorophenolicus A6]|uniref:Lipoprotein n=1 Tax=Pseudarthrobacter chlorophenolicus (strain ATCC 700700 / DSM 12829 / CIP 107037 / JCM 12360 / KCTC 9906 / NCIMB 13794 / A6) TaxID=452863 RepID=B8HF44_PSECP|nr:hypothetical protein [Pseudarthrobacter chlorophenolicus]ACL41012.1 hypothetical protein Achl_3051 [Pseudarthrobacter chlorophenolicus A6]SDQ71355.1 hypothetical protein SAMN04489738_2429 [Pseudarthrobacter chlorophenolicus]
MIRNHTSSRPFIALGVAAVLGLGLSACAAEAPAASETQPSTEATTAASASPSSSASASASASAAAPAGASGTAKDLTAPGTKLGLGEKAVTHTNTGKDPADAKYTEATYTTSVTKITAGTEADLAALKDAAKFAGQTPYYVFTEHTLDSLSKPSAGISEPRLNAQLKDGTDAQKLIILGSLDQCPTKRFETTGSSDNLSYKVGSTMTSCQVFLAPAGDEIVSADYADSGFSYASSSDNPYRKNPIVWSK